MTSIKQYCLNYTLHLPEFLCDYTLRDHLWGLQATASGREEGAASQRRGACAKS